MPALSRSYRLLQLLPLLLVVLPPNVARGQQATPELAHEVFQKVKQEFHVVTGEIAIGEIRSLHVPGVVLRLGTDSAGFAADSSTQSSAAASVARFVRKAVPDSIPVQVVVVYWTWSPRQGVSLQSRPYRFPDHIAAPPVRQ